MQCNVTVLLNDSIGSFAGGCCADPDIMVGIILGTGTNMSYLERFSAAFQSCMGQSADETRVRSAT